MAARTGGAALPLVAPLIENLIDELSASELVDFLPFIGMLCHRYKVRSSLVVTAWADVGLVGRISRNAGPAASFGLR